MVFDYSKLSGRIVEKFGTQYNFAIAMGISERSLSLKLNNRVDWRSKEITKACQELGISNDELSEYFFKQKVQELEQMV
ncbi:DUF739 family protein [Streptococcus suis]|uniref:DUF739 family protein n=1 Tax=Streptococcus suis TaxID=1307 RepID=UPI001478F1A5|nr:DUF739 family protein [Streptococcus suis]